MTPEARAELRRIGAELDGHRQIRVKDGGIVLPEPALVIDVKANDDGQREQRQPRGRQQRESREREQRQPRGRKQRQSRERERPRAPGSAASVRGLDLRSHYEAQVIQLAKAYPSARVVAADEQGMWLQVESAVLDGIDRSAAFLVAVPFAQDKFPRGWAFWISASDPKWIGPRHTNFPDGSVCAFVPASGTWLQGGELASLLDLYSVWALRHLYLEEFRRWPGRQFSPHPFYSLAEFKDDEYCSCDEDEPPRVYGVCCKPKHLAVDLLVLKAGFERTMGCRLNDRVPPQAIVDFINGHGQLPSVTATLGIASSITTP